MGLWMGVGKHEKLKSFCACNCWDKQRSAHALHGCRVGIQTWAENGSSWLALAQGANCGGTAAAGGSLALAGQLQSRVLPWDGDGFGGGRRPEIRREGGYRLPGREHASFCPSHPSQQGKAGQSSNGMLCFVFLHSRVMSSLPWATLQEKSSFWGKLRQKGTIHSFIQDNKLRTCTILQDTTQSCPFTPSMCPAGFTNRNQFAVVPLSIPASFLLHLFGQNETFYPSTFVPLWEHFYSNQITFPFFNSLLNSFFFFFFQWNWSVFPAVRIILLVILWAPNIPL